MKCQRIGCNANAEYSLEMTTKTYRPKPLDIKKLNSLRVEVYLCAAHYLSCFKDGKIQEKKILKNAVLAPS